MDIPQVINAGDASIGDMGQGYLVTGKNVDLRRWDEEPGNACQSSCRDYETVGYLISGQMEIEINGQCATLNPGDSWLVPAGAKHHYRIIETIVAIEATSPPGRFQHKDE
ncbi:cupin domain-containing protein [Allorhodopirellula solitaria]|uniref:Cupin domain protein n=1 Tax=Allorhodopirellula solitaria TaxID=2527987 RepID=A0A5C5X9Y1_9BACT|nr:cupin domain-containing protein [Allorhodopirellula solitaria]TWT59211.1 Cupin domain protein [Allorhodopirellula solitaria]